MAFGEELYCIVLQVGQSAIIYLISHLKEERSARFSLNTVLDIFRNSDHIKLPYGMCVQRGVKPICKVRVLILNLFIVQPKMQFFYDVKNHF